MNNDRNEKIINWVINKIKTEYAGDVAMLVCYGSTVNGTANSRSDVDFYFVPKTKRAMGLMQTFIIEGIGYDLFPISWERLEGFAQIKESLIPLLGDAQIRYSASEEDLEHFEKLRQTLLQNLSDSDLMHRRACEQLQTAYNMGKKAEKAEIDICSLRLIEGRVIMTLAEAVAYENHTYFKKGLKMQFHDLGQMNGKPASFMELYIAIIEARTEKQLLEKLSQILTETSTFLSFIPDYIPADSLKKENVGEISVDFQALAEIYQEISSTFNKIYICCEQGNTVLAYLSAVSLQGELDEIAGEYGFERYDLLGTYRADELSLLNFRAKEIEESLLSIFRNSGIRLRSYANIDEFIGVD